MNGTWFGKIGEAVDQVPASSFSISFTNTLTQTTETATIPAGRWKPAELAQRFT